MRDFKKILKVVLTLTDYCGKVNLPKIESGAWHEAWYCYYQLLTIFHHFHYYCYHYHCYHCLNYYYRDTWTIRQRAVGLKLRPPNLVQGGHNYAFGDYQSDFRSDLRVVDLRSWTNTSSSHHQQSWAKASIPICLWLKLYSCILQMCICKC